MKPLAALSAVMMSCLAFTRDVFADDLRLKGPTTVETAPHTKLTEAQAKAQVKLGTSEEEMLAKFGKPTRVDDVEGVGVFWWYIADPAVSTQSGYGGFAVTLKDHKVIAFQIVRQGT